MIDLESYLIPAEEGILSDEFKAEVKSQVKETAIGSLICAGIAATIAAALGISKSFKDRKAQKAEKSAILDANAKKSKDEWEKYKSSPQYDQDCKYVSNRYRVNYPADYDSEALTDRLKDAIEADLKKMANAINRNKKLCNELAEKYIESVKNDDDYETYKSQYDDEAREIKNGPACGEHFEDDCFEISDIDQSPRSWVCEHYLFDYFSAAINEKYSREIKLGIMGKMHRTGDGDEGLVAVSIHG